MSSILQVDRLGIRRGDVHILREVSWEMRTGEHWVILGANGSGKTSLLSALTGYLSPTEGEVSLLGQRYGETDWRELRKAIGIVSSSVRQKMADEEPAVSAVVSGRYAMIDYWGRITREDREDALKILERVEALHLADRPWGVLSQGERQRVLIGRALMADPRVLILDEPCAGLDPVAREHFLAFIQRLGQRRSGPALVLVTHHVEEIMPTFTHVLMLRGGEVMAAGARPNVLTSSTLSELFGAPCKLGKRQERYHLTVAPAPRAIM